MGPKPETKRETAPQPIWQLGMYDPRPNAGRRPQTCSPPNSTRARNRVAVRRSYHKKAATLEDLRAQASQLRLEYEQCLDAWNRRKLPARRQQERQRLVDDFVDLSATRDNLWQENESLQAALTQYLHASFRWQRSMDRRGETMVPVSRALTQEQRAWSHPLIIVDEMTFGHFMKCIRKAFQEVQELCAARDDMDLTTVLGWERWHAVDDDRSHVYIYKKTFHNHQATDVADRTWRLLHDPSQHKQLYTRSLRLTCHHVQEFDDDDKVVTRVYHKLGHHAAIVSVMMVSRMQWGKNGVIFLARSVEQGEVAVRVQNPPWRGMQWQDSVVWFSVEEGDTADSSVVSYGGNSGFVEGTSPWLWIVDAFMVCLQWESLYIGDNASTTSAPP